VEITINHEEAFPFSVNKQDVQQKSLARKRKTHIR